MAKNDYYVLVYRILTYLYNCLKDDVEVDMTKLTPEWLGINKRYFEYIFDTLSDEGYILNKAYDIDMAGKHLKSDIMISPTGISFLHENSTIQKVKNSIKDISDIIGNIKPL
nr:YjcQ family protein [uncultured Ligilactobacillus sp.]